MQKIIKFLVLTILLSAIAMPLTFAEKPDWAGNKKVDNPAFNKDRNRYQSEKKAAIEDFKTAKEQAMEEFEKAREAAKNLKGEERAAAIKKAEQEKERAIEAAEEAKEKALRDIESADAETEAGQEMKEKEPVKDSE